MIGFAQIEIGKGGTATCRRCGPSGGREMRAVDAILDDIRAAVVSWSGGPGPNVSFVGAEPFAHPALAQVIEVAAASGCERIRLRTDGGALASSGNAAGALQAGVRHLEVVLLAGDGAARDELTGRDGLFDAMRRGVESFVAQARASATPIAFTGYVPVCRHNASDIARIVATFGSLGAVSVRLEPHNGFALDAGGLAVALTTATVAGMALHGPGVAPFSAEPWRPVGGPA